MNILNVNDVQIYSDDHKHLLLDSCSFNLSAGEVLAIIGPNGAGKTTTMRILSGYLPATSGTAKIAGHDVHDESMAVRQNIGYLPEKLPLYPEMTVEGFLALMISLMFRNFVTWSIWSFFSSCLIEF